MGKPVTVTVDLTDVYAAIADVQKNVTTANLALLSVMQRVTALETPPVVELPAFTAAVVKWEADMPTYGAQAAATLADPNVPVGIKQDSTYYDLTWVFLQIKAFTGDPTWQAAADNAHSYYRSYIDPNNGKIIAYWQFPHGLHEYGDDATVKLLAVKTGYEYPLVWSVSCGQSREVAYHVITKKMAVDLGQPVWGLEEQAAQMFGHVAQWTEILNGQPCTGLPDGVALPTYCRPFMAALTSYAMIEWAGADAPRLSQVVGTLSAFWSLCWSKCFVAQQPVQNNPGLGLVDSMTYTNCEAIDGTGGQQPSPDLNLLIAPVLAWMYKQTKEIAWRDKHDVLFIGGVQGAYLGGGKQFSQNYQRSFQGLEWRKG